MSKKNPITPVSSIAKNVLGGVLESCCQNPITGFYRDGFCHTGDADYGKHVVCIIATDEFLEFSKRDGNDLSTPRPEYSFPGLKVGMRWCLCAERWHEAMIAGFAPPVILEACHEDALKYVTLQQLRQYTLQ